MNDKWNISLPSFKFPISKYVLPTRCLVSATKWFLISLFLLLKRIFRAVWWRFNAFWGWLDAQYAAPRLFNTTATELWFCPHVCLKMVKALSKILVAFSALPRRVYTFPRSFKASPNIKWSLSNTFSLIITECSRTSWAFSRFPLSLYINPRKLRASATCGWFVPWKSWSISIPCSQLSIAFLNSPIL